MTQLRFLSHDGDPPSCLEPDDPERERTGMFRDHNCWRCRDGRDRCVQRDPKQCEYPHARND